MHRNSVLLFEKYAKPLFKGSMRVLEVGPDAHPSTYKQLVGDPSIKWETIDIFSSSALTYVAKDEYTFPIPDQTYDIVLSGQVIEHVRKIWRWARELSRVCKKGGLVITVNPVSWVFHEVPVDCWRIYPDGMKALYDEAGLTMQLSKFETLDHPSLWFRVKQALKPFLGREAFPLPVVDTISIGVKEAPVEWSMAAPR
jgi:SAM-dependent methyltransferase